MMRRGMIEVRDSSSDEGIISDEGIVHSFTLLHCCTYMIYTTIILLHLLIYTLKLLVR